MYAVEYFPTTAEREVARKLVAILEPMTLKQRKTFIERYWAFDAGAHRFREIFGS